MSEPSTNQDCCLLIPVHNRREITLACLAHLQAQGDLALFKVLLLDDGCTDGTPEAVTERFPGVEILRGPGDWYWTGAIAAGMKHAFAQGAKAVLWLNDDCLPEKDSLKKLVEQSVRNPRQLVSARCVNARDGSPLSTGFIGRRILRAAPGRLQSAQGLSGYCVLIPRAAWEQLGEPDAVRFPHYAADSAYTLHAWRKGWQPVILGDAPVRLTHHEARRPGPSCNPGLSWKTDYRRNFQAPGSAARLATQWHLLRLKYGRFFGSLLALIKMAGWISRFTLARLRRAKAVDS